MESRPIWVIIPTSNRAALLDRTLSSLAHATLPSRLTAVIVAENGEKSGAEDVAGKYRPGLPIRYEHSPVGNKSRALNAVIARANDELLIFFDDDIRVHRETLMVYAQAASTHGPGHFFAGRCYIDYETPPPEWLKPYLPNSAKGWGPGDAKVPLTSPQALGFNWAAFAADLREVGGFDEHRGPGVGMLGDETALQRKLMANGGTGYYLPDAVVWHFVPQARCSVEWCLTRAPQHARDHGLAYGLALARARPVRRFAHALKCRSRVMAIALLLKSFGRHMTDERLFHWRYELARCRGWLEGLAAARAPAAAGRTPGATVGSSSKSSPER